MVERTCWSHRRGLRENVAGKDPVRVYAQGCLVGDLAAGGLAVAEVEFGLWGDGDEEIVLA